MFSSVAGVAQLVEQLFRKQQVVSSILTTSFSLVGFRHKDGGPAVCLAGDSEHQLFYFLLRR